jgi:A/G-specific adenine glycosylase
MAKTSISAPKATDLLGWYRVHGRDLPWRSHAGRAPSPYHTWLSEIMLQQTGVITVIPYYERFTTKWPSVQKLAAANEDDVLKEWAGLGYYSRARNLLKCAGIIAKDYNGIFPDDVTELKKLPGIGDYTANAIRAIAYDQPANVVDGNVERVTARVFAFDQPINVPANKIKLKELAATLAPQTENSHYAQAIMDLGATICTPRNPKCPLCPWNKNCLAFATGQTDKIPVVQKRAKSPERHTHVFVMHDDRNRFLLRQRPVNGLLGGLWEFPSTGWDKTEPDTVSENETLLASMEMNGFAQLPKPVIHVFTHFRLTSTVFVHQEPVRPEQVKDLGQWFSPNHLPALSTLTVKILEAAHNGLLEIKKTG